MPGDVEKAWHSNGEHCYEKEPKVVRYYCVIHVKGDH